jgi:hypothetical protein
MKVIRLTPAERAAITRKWRRASAKAHATARNAKLFAKYALGKAGWKVASFDSRKGFEYKGVVDLVAVKRDNRSPDELTIMLVQVKGGSARVTKDELSRLHKAASRLKVTWNVAAKPAKTVRFKKSLG